MVRNFFDFFGLNKKIHLLSLFTNRKRKNRAIFDRTTNAPVSEIGIKSNEIQQCAHSAIVTLHLLSSGSTHTFTKWLVKYAQQMNK